MGNFHYFMPTDCYFGRGCVAEHKAAMAKLGKKAMVVTGKTSAKRNGAQQDITDALDSLDIAWILFDEIEENPSVETVERAAKLAIAEGVEFFIGIGGGSPMDVAKAVGVVAKYGGSITEYEGADKVPGEIIPLIAIPTTAGTGSEVTAFSVITDHERNYKLTVFSYKLIPAYALLDPLLLTSAPASVAAACGIDALIHAEESYVSLDASPFSEAMSEKAMELIGRSIRTYVADRSNLEAASDMLAGSLFAGIAFSWARLGNIHAMSHPVSAFFNVPHGVANGILFPYIVKYNEEAAFGKYQKIYNYISTEEKCESEFSKGMLEQAVRELNTQVGIPAKLSDAGVTDEYFAQMTEDAMKSGNIAINPQKTVREDILALYKEAL